MRVKSIVSILVLSILLAACGTSTGTPPVVVTESPFIPAPATETPLPYMPPAEVTPAPFEPAYPAPSTPSAGTPQIPPSGYEPQPGDENLKRDTVSLDKANSQLVITISDPVQAKAILVGTMSDPCHSLRVVVTPADANNVISLDVYSVVDTSTVCVTKIEPFIAPIPLGSYSAGQYTLMVNGESLGQFSGTYAAQPGDDQLSRGDVNLDLSQSKLVFIGDLADEEAASLKGTLSDPCHQLRLSLAPPDSQNKINLEAYSVFDPQAMCVMVIVPFQVVVPLGNNPAGHYSVYVNGQLLGEFDK